MPELYIDESDKILQLLNTHLSFKYSSERWRDGRGNYNFVILVIIGNILTNGAI